MPLEALSHDVTPVGLHYLLVHYDIPLIEEKEWRLNVGGLVGRDLSLSIDELRARPAVTLTVTMECAGNGRAALSPRPISQPWLLEAVGTAEWTGTPLRGLLEEAGLKPDAVEILFSGRDRGVEGGEAQQFERSLPLDEALRDDVLLAYEMNGSPLPPQHGFPLRLMVPGWYGMTNVKWLERITALEQPFSGYQQARGYRLRQDPGEEGEPLTRMLPRSLMIPPGIPDFGTRERTVRAGPCPVRGRAWSGLGAIERVEFSADGGAGWADARLGPQADGWAWRSWKCEWEPNEPGPRELCCRATDAAGNTQPLEAPWNLGGYANNAVQRVPVTITSE
jgi:DMSO/TMAO reductase YedYZ molybdopterin-dependent catalytic subunit